MTDSKYKKCEYDYDHCETHGLTNDHCELYVDAMHEELHHWISLVFIDKLIKEKCKFCTEDE